MDRYMTVRTHGTQISFGVDPCWAGFRDWLVVMNVDESSTPNTVRASEVYAACCHCWSFKSVL